MFQLRIHGPQRYWLCAATSTPRENRGRALQRGFSVDRIKRLQHLFGPGTDTDVFREVHPLNRSVAVDQEFGRTRYIFLLRAGVRMEEIVTPNHFRFGIGKNWKRVTELLPVTLAGIGRINTDCDDTNPASLEFRQPFLETPQLGVTKWSPETAVENQERRGRFRVLRRYQIG